MIKTLWWMCLLLMFIGGAFAWIEVPVMVFTSAIACIFCLITLLALWNGDINDL